MEFHDVKVKVDGEIEITRKIEITIDFGIGAWIMAFIFVSVCVELFKK